MTDDHTTEPATLASPLTLPCGAVLANRICNAAMTEGLADPMNRAMERHVALYGRWAEGGAGLNLTGNVQVDRRYMERPGNVAIDGTGLVAGRWRIEISGHRLAPGTGMVCFGGPRAPD